MNRLLSGLLMIFLALSPLMLIGNSIADAKEATATAQHKASLFADLAYATTELEGRHIEDAIWRLWFDSAPTAEIRGWLDAGIERREAYDYEAAELHLDKVVRAAPEFAEGYNQRAFIRFLRDDFSQSQADLERALELEPKHFGAMSGLFLVLFRQNQQDSAMKMLQQAVTVHPWLKERSSLPKSWWPEQYRRIHNPDQEI